MLKTLLKNSFALVFSSMFKSKKTQKNRGPLVKVAIAVLALYVLACLFGMFVGLFYGMYKVTNSIGMPWFYFSAAGLLAFVFCFIGSVFAAQKQLFEAKDNELLLSMPIPPFYILLSRVLVLVLINYLYEAFVLLPAIAVYFLNAGFSLTVLIAFIIGFAFMPFLATVFSSIFGWIIALISSRLHNKNIIPTVFSLVFLSVYFYAYSQFNKIIQNLVRSGETIANAIKKTVFPIYHFGVGIANSDFFSLLLFVLFSVLLFAIMCFVLAKSFIKIATSNKGAAKIKYKEKSMKQASIGAALIKREFKHFASNPLYMINAGFGLIFSVVLPVALIIKKSAMLMVIEQFPIIKDYVAPVLILSLCALAATNFISAPSLSLEGKCLWIVKSLPVKGSQVLLAKAYAHIIICLPFSLLSSVIVAFAMNFSWANILLAIIAPAVFTVFQGLFGIFVNLKFPKFDYINEVAVVKQSMSVLIAMLGSLALVIGSGSLYLAVKSVLTTEMYTLIITIVWGVLAYVIYKYLKTKGNKVFAVL